MGENKQYILIPFEEGNLIFKDDGREFFNSVDCLKDNEIVDLLNEQEKEIQRLKLIINGLNYALKNIRQIDVEIDLNECGDVE